MGSGLQIAKGRQKVVRNNLSRIDDMMCAGYGVLSAEWLLVKYHMDTARE
jgi:hypothetical protein